jgi:hypothetical protein
LLLPPLPRRRLLLAADEGSEKLAGCDSAAKNEENERTDAEAGTAADADVVTDAEAGAVGAAGASAGPNGVSAGAKAGAKLC